MFPTEWDKSIIRRELGGTPKRWADARICQAARIAPGQWVGCNKVVVGYECDRCGRRTREFHSRHFLRFPRLPEKRISITESIVNRDYSYPHAHFVQAGRVDSNRRRH